MSTRPVVALSALLVAVVASAAGCSRRNTVETPNRVLDRPVDLVLACVNTDGESIFPTSIEQCADTISACGTLGSNQLVGFIANSERNEVAMFRECAGELVDMDPESPGFQFIPVGSLPQSLTATGDSCQAMVANVGSCDVTVLDVPALSAAALEIEVDGAPSSRVTTVTPRLADGTPLAARPGQILAVPRALSAAESVGIGGGIDVTDGLCDPTRPSSIYATFPACQLIAEIDLKTERILQSRRFLTDADGNVTVEDAGASPSCPIECPEQFDGVVPESPVGDAGGVFPAVLALIAPPTNLETATAADLQIEDAALFVGGAGSEWIFEFPITDRTLATEATELELSGSSGVLGIRPTPVMALDGGAEAYHQFLYVVAGDGSTRVVRRNLSSGRDEIGIECDTQVDPTLITETICDPAAYPGDDPPDRRPFAEGPGIRAPGATITDWSFQRVVQEEAIDELPDEASTGTRYPFGSEGVVGVGVTNLGRIVLSSFGQFQGGTVVDAALDPLQLFAIQILPHTLWPLLDPRVIEPLGLPRVDDKEPARLLSPDGTEANQTDVLAPSLRRIDLAYSDACPSTSACDLLTDQSGAPISNADGFGDLDAGELGELALYKTPAVRAIPRDYREWGAGAWVLGWEDEIPGTLGNTGQILCDTPSASGAYCVTTNPDGSRLRDDAAAFCDAGVLPGDKVFLHGCASTEDCGPGQICMRDEANAASIGICVSAEAYDDPELRQDCWEYIHDPCGSPLREFLITRATQTELTLQALNIRKSSVYGPRLDPITGEKIVDPETDEPVVGETIARLVCSEEQPDGGCEANVDCDGIVDEDGRIYPYCFDGVCRRPCADGEECILRRLPGPRCFGELVRYQVFTHNAFRVAGPGRYSFMAERVKVAEDGACYEDPSVSSLLTSRIRLGADEADTRENALWPIQDCPSENIPDTGAPNPCFIPDVRPGALNSNSAERIFHLFNYGGQEGGPVPAIRYSNPMFSLVLDLTSLEGLASDGGWPAADRAFVRARIPRNYQQTFTTLDGYRPINDPAVVRGVPLVGPVRVVSGPEVGTIYVVDAAGRGGSNGIRGQVMRVTLAPNIVADENFIVR